MNFNILEDYKNYIGMAFFAVSIILLLYLFINPSMGLYIHIDEYYTLGVIQLPFDNAWKLIINDVHPPLYYLILMAANELFNMLHIPVSPLYLSKLLSLLPLVILIIVSYTKIRRDYGWFTCGLFLFGISTMATMEIIFITSRMYSWSVLFMTMAFIYYMDILKKSDKKSWILLTLFTILCAYTHYILVFPLFVMYLAYYLYIDYNDRIDKKTEVKKMIKSIIASIILYIPWIFTLITQISTINKTYSHSAKLSGDALFNFMTCYVLQDTKQLLDLAFWKFLVVLLAIMLIILFVTEIKNFKDHEAYSIFSGINIYLFTILLASFFVTFMFKGITVRYFVSIVAILWLSIAILLSKVKNYKALLVVLIIIITLGAHGIMTNVNDINYHNDLGLKEKNVTSSINNPDTVVIYNGTYTTHHFLLNNAKEYSLKAESKFDNPTYILEENMSTIIADNPDKDIYLVSTMKDIKDNDEKFPDGITGKKLARQGRVWIMKLSQENNSTDEEYEYE